MNLLKKYIQFLIILLTIPIDAKISMQNMQNSVSQIFTTKKQKNIDFQEFNGVQKLELLCEQGNITIQTWKQPTTMFEIKHTGSQAQISSTKVDFLYHENLLQVKTICNDPKTCAKTDLTILVPEKTSIKVATKMGNIAIRNLENTIHAHTDSGNIDIVDGIGNTTITTTHGNILIQRETMQHTEFINATTDRGSINVQVPQNINCHINAHTKNGKIYSDLLINVHSKTIKLTDETYKQQRQQLVGTITKEETEKAQGYINLENKQGTIKIKNYV